MSDVIFELKNVKKWFPARRNLGQLLSGERKWIKAVTGFL